jgi:hypothetical protein
MRANDLREQTVKLLRYPWFPYLFALGFPLTVYSHNQAAFPFHQLIRPSLAFLLAAVALVFLARCFVRNGNLVAVLAAAAMVGLWHFGLGLAYLALLLALILAGALLRRRSVPDAVVPVCNALSVGVLLLPVITIGQVESLTRDNVSWDIKYSPFTSLTGAQIRGEKPDLYHIVLDAYGGEDALGGMLGFDNSNFFDALRDLGFVVNESIQPPYNETVHIMSSIYLGEYLRPDEFPFVTDNPTVQRAILGTLIVNGPVHSMLRGNGYNVLYTDPGHDFLRFPKGAIVLLSDDSGPLNRFENYLGSLAGLQYLLPEIYQVTREHPLIRSVKSAFKQDFSDFESPKFVYQHVLAPHTPFVIDRHGETTGEYPQFTGTSEGDSVVQNDPKLREQYIAGYLEKLRYVNEQVLQQVKRLREQGGSKIIILQGDHGSGAYYALNDAEKSCLRERFSTFLAVYTDDPKLRKQLEWISAKDAAPVNLYRSLYNGLIGTSLDLLPRKSAFVRKSTPHLISPLDDERIKSPCH